MMDITDNGTAAAGEALQNDELVRQLGALVQQLLEAQRNNPEAFPQESGWISMLPVSLAALGVAWRLWFGPLVDGAKALVGSIELQRDVLSKLDEVETGQDKTSMMQAKVLVVLDDMHEEYRSMRHALERLSSSDVPNGSVRSAARDPT